MNKGRSQERPFSFIVLCLVPLGSGRRSRVIGMSGVRLDQQAFPRRAQHNASKNNGTLNMTIQLFYLIVVTIAFAALFFGRV